MFDEQELPEPEREGYEAWEKQQEINRLRVALEFYAKEANYATPQGNASPPPAVALDGGRKAREALA